MDFITFKHSFNPGDLITVLPGIKHICEKNNTKAIIYQRLGLLADYGHSNAHPTKDEDGREVCMNKRVFNLMQPLIQAQSYVESFEVWEGQEVQFDYDKTRQNSQMPLPGGSIHKWPSLIYPQLECELSGKWIEVESAKLQKTPAGHFDSGCVSISDGIWTDNICSEVTCSGNILINRTSRYNNPYITYHFLKEYTNRIIFLGSKEECDSFCKEWGLGCDSWNYIYRLNANSFYQLAQAIKHCKLFIGNQSFCWHVADAMKVPRILEVCAQFPNTFPTGENGYSFITQEALEFRFHKLLNESNA
jgi:hypothetical protein